MGEIKEEFILSDQFSASFSKFLNLGNTAIDQMKRIDQSVTRTGRTMRRSIGGAAGAVITNMRQMGNSANEINSTGFDRLEAQLLRIADNTSSAESEQERHNQRVRETNNSAGTLLSTTKQIVDAAAAFKWGKKLLGLSDEMTQTTARINSMNKGFESPTASGDGNQENDSVNNSLQETERIQDLIFRSAQRTRTSYLATADVVAKMGQKSRNAFSGSDEVVDFVENLNKQFIIAGASQQETSSAFQQLTQAMGSGVLQGEDLNSIFEAAPNVIQTIADYLDVPIEKVQEMASNGEITAGIVKNAMLSATDRINQEFNSMPMTYQQVWTAITNSLLQAFQPVIQLIGQGAAFIYENWSSIEPVFYGLAVGVLVAAAAWGIYTAAMWISKAANQELVASMLTNPFVLIAIVIAAVVAQIYSWVQSVGGIKIAWLICVNEVLTHADLLRLGFMAAWSMIKIGMLDTYIAFESFRVKVLNGLGNMRVNALTILQDLVNGAIDRINDLIGVANNIPGVSIDLIEHVDFASDAAMEEQMEQQQRAAILERKKEAISGAKAELKNEFDRAQKAAGEARKKRLAGIEAAKEEAAKEEAARKAAGDNVENGSSENGFSENGSGNIGTVDKVGSVGKIDQDVNIADENIKLLRDLSERQYVALVNLTVPQTNLSVSQNVEGGGGSDIEALLKALNNALGSQHASSSNVASG